MNNKQELVSSNLKSKSVQYVNGSSAGAYVSEYEAVGGLSLRDYFAAKALQGITANEGVLGDQSLREIAERSYQFADAMMKERSK